MRIVLSGASGLIGGAVGRSLAADGHEVIALTRSPRADDHARWVVWDGRTVGDWATEVDGADAVIHLAGESLAGGRWTASRQARIRNSRVQSTAAIVAAIERADRRPKVLISGSAVGFYGACGDDPVTEADGPGRDFLAQVCLEWESAARLAAAYGVRLVLLRTGIVLSPHGGALAAMLPVFRLGLGGRLGSGRQGFPWIHLDDEVGLIRWALDEAAVDGPLNATAPNPVSNAAFTAALNRALGRPGFLPVPAAALKLTLGQQADMLLTGAFVQPQKALDLGYRFRFPTLDEALADVLGKP